MSLKSWGFELWDQVDKIFIYTNQGLDQLELFYKTVSDIQKIYLSLVKKYKNLSPVPAPKTKLILESSTYFASLNKIFQSFSEQASVYENQAEELRTSVLLPIKTFLDHSKTTINDQTREFTKFKQKIERIKATLDAAWARYYGAYVIKKKADAAHNRVKDDKTVPRVDIEKLQAIANQKDSDLDKMKGDYAGCLEKFNKERTNLYLKDLPKICSELEIIDRQRAEMTIEVGLALVTIQESNLKKTGDCNMSFGEAIRMIDFKADSRSLVETYRNTLMVPADIVFVNFANCRSDNFNVAEFPGLQQQGGRIEKSDVAKSLFAGPGLRGIDIKEMLQDQVKQRVDDISTTITSLDKELGGLKTLYETYRKDPNMGDKSKLEPQIDIIERKLVSVREMHDTVSKHCQSGGGGRVVSAGPAKITPVKSTESVSGDEDSSFEDDEDFDNQDGDVDKNVKLALVLYRFEATDPQQISVDADQKVKVLNYDDGGTGWTLVQNKDNVAIKGYVPTNYIQLQ